MFVVDAAVLLPHPPHAVARVVERLHALPRWCAGLRRVRHLAHDGDAPAGCVFTYVAADVRLTLRARTLDHGPGEPVRHAAEGDGVALTWTLAVEPEPAGGLGHRDHGPQTRLRAHTALVVDPAHPTAAVRAALYRLLARRAPADLERLRALLDRYEFGKRPAGPVPTGLLAVPAPDVVLPAPGALAPVRVAT